MKWIILFFLVGLILALIMGNPLYILAVGVGLIIPLLIEDEVECEYIK